ncbi:hypothetical protein EBB07_33145 [Paenibacillaceae bacterium]|nr:hypothetical protein EBB07_33145 [Paenibacillaceae bacterium]
MILSCALCRMQSGRCCYWQPTKHASLDMKSYKKPPGRRLGGFLYDLHKLVVKADMVNSWLLRTQDPSFRNG